MPFGNPRYWAPSALAAAVLLAICVAQASAADLAADRTSCRKLQREGNFAEAYDGFRKLTLDPNDDAMLVGGDLMNAIACLERLNRVNEIDAFREEAIQVHEKNWRLLQTAANSYLNVQHNGVIVAGEFQRGPHRGGGQWADARERDRVRALQLMTQALPLAEQDTNRRDAATFLLDFAEMWLNGRSYGGSWVLQSLTDLSVLPDFSQGRYGYYGQTQGAPVDENGDPIFYTVPESFDAAENDGQRWRWCLTQAMEFDASRRSECLYRFASFLHEQFGVQTMASYGFFFGRMHTDDTQDAKEGVFALHTLGENETIAKLATGVKRFELPDEFNYIRLFEEVFKTRGGYQETACGQLASIFENRRQYPRAAEYCEEGVERFQPKDNWKQRLDQIVGKWGMLESTMAKAAGEGAKLEYRFRNGTEVTFEAHAIDVRKLLDDVKAYIKSRPARIDGQKLNIHNIGWRLVRDKQDEYLTKRVAKWTLSLEPREDHFDKRVTVDTPLQAAGAYLVKAVMKGGNTEYIVVWINDTAIAKKQLDNQTYYFIADAATGRPVAKANVELFGWRQEHKGNQRFEIYTKQFAEFADADGQVFLSPEEQPNNFQWLVTATTDQGRFAHLGFQGVWYNRRYDAEYDAARVFTITDRPVYRPEQAVHYKLWARVSKYDMGDVSEFAGHAAKLEIRNPKGENIVEKTVTLDEYGGVEGDLELATDAQLGVYFVQLQLQGRVQGGGSFRVEEYKKPEFEVAVEAPSEPVMLGEKMTAKVEARYYFGEPVGVGTVKYTVKRTPYSDDWYPVRPWDWFYGPGYWWFAYDYAWYPGWRDWGCPAPYPFWNPRPSLPPEVVAERTLDLGADGVVNIDIDTELAKVMHGDQDHKYEITVEVTDPSRRTIVGSGQVLVARKPFKVFAWIDRGHYNTGDTVRADFQARTLDGKPVEGRGLATLYKVAYKDDKPIERPVYKQAIDTNVEGRANLQMLAAAPGQYRIAYTLTDKKNHEIEGGYVFTVIGRGADADDFRFNAVELVPEKTEYAPGETVRMQVNVNEPNGTVLLFDRPTNGVYLPPRVLRIDGKSTTVDIGVAQRDMPNFFVEAVTIADGQVHSTVREICVPPEKRILNVEIEPSSETYRPGEKAKVKVRLTDLKGNPFVGSTVVSIYDKAVEYISGGSNVGDIKEFFWKWRRHHNPSTVSNLGQYEHQITPDGKQSMRFLGVFGQSVADDFSIMEQDKGLDGAAMAMDRGGMVYGGGGMALGAMNMRGAVSKASMMPAPMAGRAMEAASFAADDAVMAGAPMTAAPGPGGGDMQPPALVEATVRKEFADTALWIGSLTTDKNGYADVELDMPDNLTTWKIMVWGMGQGTRVGEGSTEVITRKGLIIRMQTPRFFTQTDEVVLSANVHNYLESEKKVRVSMEWEGGLQLLSKQIISKRAALDPSAAVETITVAPGDQQRVDWIVQVTEPGDIVLRMKAQTDEESDAMEMTIPAQVHGMLKQEAVSGALRPSDTKGEFTIRVPSERRPAETRLEVRYSPTLAGSMVDALPYLLDYPYGCTEQTLNRFVPAVITQKILIDMGLDLEEIQKVRANLNAQELGTHEERAEQWKRYKRNPVFDQGEMTKIVKDGVNRLTEMQLSDGGWGWFSGYYEHSAPHTTAVVVHGLQQAQANDVALVPGVLDRGVAWLDRYQDEQITLLKRGELPPEQRKGKPYKMAADNIDAFVNMVLVDAGKKNDVMRDYLYRDRTKISVYAMAMYGLALEKQGEREKLDMILRNIGQYVEQDDENQTAWLNLPGGYWWYWYGSEYEAHAYYLKLIAKTDPKGELAPRLVKYLLNNRKHATYWNSTRDTALCVEALADFLIASGENKPDMTVEVYYDGKLQKAVEITPETLFRFDNAFVLTGADVTDGEHVIELRKKGTGPLYYNGYLQNFTLEDPITAAGLEIKVQRKLYRLKRVEDATAKVAGSRGQVIDQKVEKYERELLAADEELKSGDLVEVELEIESKNDYESLIFEDMKAAGFEPVEVRSGYNGNAMGAYVEYRDNRVVFFVRRLMRGKHSVAYRMRAEIPGRFSALPTKGWAMYAPELKANSDEFKVRIAD